ncbi:hypothetical protein VdG1_00717 [Verticillium dahliae VDG1]|nr:hypothetical protein VdG1_00717 [Verticillium dahliae VDG1]
MSPHESLKATFAARAQTATHPLTAYLFRLMDLKASNLCLSADVSTARELLHLADKVGPSIVVLKTHHDVLARKHGFLIFEDRKFGDIGNTVQLQYVAGSARIIEWAHIINVNMVPGKAAVTALAEAEAKWRERYQYEVKTSVTVGTPRSETFDEHEEDAIPRSTDEPRGGYREEGRKGSIVSVTTLTQHYESASSPRFPRSEMPGDDILYAGIEEPPMERGLLILAQMSSAGNFMNQEYTQACVEAARENRNFVMGYGQQYNTPQKLVGLCGTDIVIVGRGILKAGDPQSEAERYRTRAWKAYLSRVAQN